jgi:hypothetical protein
MRYSTYLKSVKYDSSSQQMDVTFTDGAVIRYYGISARTHHAVQTAKSPGEKFSELVRDNYRFTVLKQAA